MLQNIGLMLNYPSFILARFSLVKIGFSFTFSSRKIFFYFQDIKMRGENNIYICHMLYHHEKEWKESFRDLHELFSEKFVALRMNHGLSSKTLKERRSVFLQKISPKGKPKDVQCKKANVVYLVRQKRNRSLGDHFKRRYWCNGEDERQQWWNSDKNGKWKLNINSDVYLNHLYATFEAKQPRKKTKSSFTMIMHVHTLSVVSSNLSPIRTWNCFHIHHTHVPKSLRATSSIDRWNTGK